MNSKKNKVSNSDIEDVMALKFNQEVSSSNSSSNEFEAVEIKH